VNVGLAKAVRNLDANYQLAQTNANRWVASQTEVGVVEEQYKAGRVTLDIVLEAQRRRAQAQNAFWVSVAEYNKSISDLHTRKGSIMAYNGICMEEGPWPEKAYFDSLQRARERDAGIYFDYGYTRPSVISRGETPQGPGGPISPDGLPGEISLEEIARPEGTPTPAVEPSPSDMSPMPGADPAPSIMPETGPTTSTRRPIPGITSSGNPLRRITQPVGSGVVPASYPGNTRGN